MKYLQLVADTIVQTVRDYPKGFLIVLAVAVVVGVIF